MTQPDSSMGEYTETKKSGHQSDGNADSPATAVTGWSRLLQIMIEEVCGRTVSLQPGFEHQEAVNFVGKNE